MRIRYAILLASIGAAAAFAHWPGPTRSGRVSPSVREVYSIASNRLRFAYHVLDRDCTAVTLCGWIRLVTPYGNLVDATFYDFSDGPPQSTGPDLLSGGFAWPAGAVFSGATNIPLALADSQPYCLVGLASNPATISLGGSSIVVTGSFDRVVLAGPSDAVSLTTAGWAKLGLVATSTNAWYGYTDGLAAGEGADIALQAHTGVGTNWSWSSWTWRCTAATNWVALRLCYPQGTGTVLSASYRHVLSPAGRIRCGAQMRVGAVDVFAQGGWQLFDFRVLYSAPSVADLDQIYADGYYELLRRGLSP